MRPSLLPLAAAVLATAGCYSYLPVTGAPSARSEIEAVLTDSGTLNVAPRIGPNAGSILGRVVGVRGDTIDLAIAEVRTRTGTTYYLRGTTVPLLRGDLSSIRVRTLDKGRTVVAVSATVLGAAALAAGVSAISGGSDNTGGGGGTPAMRPPE